MNNCHRLPLNTSPPPHLHRDDDIKNARLTGAEHVPRLANDRGFQSGRDAFGLM